MLCVSRRFLFCTWRERVYSMPSRLLFHSSWIGFMFPMSGRIGSISPSFRSCLDSILYIYIYIGRILFLCWSTRLYTVCSRNLFSGRIWQLFIMCSRLLFGFKRIEFML